MRSLTPLYQDACLHGPDAYIGTVQESLNGKMVDIYLYGSSGVCMRFGDEPPDYSSIDGRLVVDIDTTQAENPDVDHHAGSGVPKLRLWVNECKEELDEDGEWIRKPWP